MTFPGRKSSEVKTVRVKHGAEIKLLRKLKNIMGQKQGSQVYGLELKVNKQTKINRKAVR